MTLLLSWIENIKLTDCNCFLNESICTKDRNLPFFSLYKTEHQRDPAINLEKETTIFLNNIFCITAKLFATHENELTLIWKRIVSSFSGNLYVVLHYLFIVISLSPNSMLPIVCIIYK